MATSTALVAPAPSRTRAPVTDASRPHTRWGPRKVRTRILGWYAVLLLAAVATSIVLERQILLTRMNRRIDAALTDRANELTRLAAAPPTGRSDTEAVHLLLDSFLSRHEAARGESFLAFADGHPYRTVLTPAATAPDAALRRWAALRLATRGTVETNQGQARYVAVPIGAGASRGVLVAMFDPSDERADADAAVLVLAIVSLSVVVISSLFAWVVAGHVLAPIGAVTSTARRLSERDLSERIAVAGDDEVAELAATFNQMLDRLETAFATRRDFLNDVSHELRTPITIIRGHLELMGDDPEERREVFTIVTEELDRMARLVNDLLVLARAEQPGFLQCRPVDAAELTESVVAKLEGLPARHWAIDGVARTTVEADRDRLTQAIVNLASNAVAHTKDGDTIHIGSAEADGAVRFWVRDHGPGLDAEAQARIFERYERVNGSRANGGPRRSGGLGLGLAIVRTIAEGHGGAVSVESAPGEGATFTITVPTEPLGGKGRTR